MVRANGDARASDDWRDRVSDTPCASCEHYPEELMNAAAELAHSERLVSLGTLIAGVAHELANPAGYVLSNLAVLQSYGHRLLCYIAAIEAGASESARIELREELRIDRILADLESLVDGSIEGAERIHANVMSLGRYATPQREEARPYNLSETVRTAVAWVSRASGNRVPASYELPDRCLLTGHSNAVHQVLINLVQNAVDAMAGRNDAELEVTVSERAEWVEVCVRDNGPGLYTDDPDKLFLPFVTSKPAGEGTGLGLSISHSIARQEGGSLGAANHPDGGAAFTLTLPRVAPDAR